jgi:hypothetical protein
MRETKSIETCNTMLKYKLEHSECTLLVEHVAVFQDIYYTLRYTSLLNLKSEVLTAVNTSTVTFFNPEGGGEMFLRNTGNHLQDYMELQHRRPQSTMELTVK